MTDTKPDEEELPANSWEGLSASILAALGAAALLALGCLGGVVWLIVWPWSRDWWIGYRYHLRVSPFRRSARRVIDEMRKEADTKKRPGQ